MCLGRALAYAQKSGTVGGGDREPQRSHLGTDAAAGLRYVPGFLLQATRELSAWSLQAGSYIWQHLGAQPLWAPSALSFPIFKTEMTVASQDEEILECVFQVAEHCLYL